MDFKKIVESVDDELYAIENGGWEGVYGDGYEDLLDSSKAKEIHKGAQEAGLSDIDYVNKMDLEDELYMENTTVYEIETGKAHTEFILDCDDLDNVYNRYVSDMSNRSLSPSKIMDKIKDVLDDSAWEITGRSFFEDSIGFLKPYASDSRTPKCKEVYEKMLDLVEQFNNVCDEQGCSSSKIDLQS